MTTLLITGANRGLGLEHSRQALAEGQSVIACCRDPDAADVLKALAADHGRLRLEAVDVTSAASVQALAARLRGIPIDILFNCAGIYGYGGWSNGVTTQSLTGMDFDMWEAVLRTNLLGPFRLTGALLDNVLAGKGRLVVMMSSELGSIAGNTLGGAHAYRTSKAALNMTVRGLAADLKNQGVTVIALSPGWTRTDMGGPAGQWSTPDSVAAQRKVLAKAALADSGRFINLTGEPLPW